MSTQSIEDLMRPDCHRVSLLRSDTTPTSNVALDLPSLKAMRTGRPSSGSMSSGVMRRRSKDQAATARLAYIDQKVSDSIRRSRITSPSSHRHVMPSHVSAHEGRVSPRSMKDVSTARLCAICWENTPSDGEDLLRRRPCQGRALVPVSLSPSAPRSHHRRSQSLHALLFRVTRAGGA